LQNLENALARLRSRGRDNDYWRAHRHSEVRSSYLNDGLLNCDSLHYGAKTATKTIGRVLKLYATNGWPVPTYQRVLETVQGNNASAPLLYSVVRRLVDLIMASQANEVLENAAGRDLFYRLRGSRELLVTEAEIRQLRNRRGDLMDHQDRFADLIAQSTNFFKYRSAFSFWELCRTVAVVRGPKRLLEAEELEAMSVKDRGDYGNQVTSVASFCARAAAMLDELESRRRTSRQGKNKKNKGKGWSECSMQW
jgi:hypothetical protein